MRASRERHIAEILSALTADIANSYVSTIPSAGPANAQLMTLLHRMNGTRSLADGSVPLRQFLRAAAMMTRGMVCERVFKDALDCMGAVG